MFFYIGFLAMRVYIILTTAWPSVNSVGRSAAISFGYTGVPGRKAARRFPWVGNYIVKVFSNTIVGVVIIHNADCCAIRSQKIAI